MQKLQLPSDTVVSSCYMLEFLRQRSCCVEQFTGWLAFTGCFTGHFRRETKNVPCRTVLIDVHLLPWRIYTE